MLATWLVPRLPAADRGKARRVSKSRFYFHGYESAIEESEPVFEAGQLHATFSEPVSSVLDRHAANERGED